MARIDVPFVVEKQHISQPTRDTLVAGGRNYFYATFTVNDTWDDISNIKVVFSNGNVSKLVPLYVTDAGYECRIPWEMMAEKGIFHIGIFGGDRMITDTAYLEVKSGCATSGGEPLAPTPDWFSEIEADLAAVSKKAEEIDTIKDDIEGIQQQIIEESHFRGYVSTNAKIQSLEATPNDFAYSAESCTTWVYDVENGWQDTGVPVPDQLTPASETTPLSNGVASAGTENAYARGDHRHPTDTTRASVEDLKALGDAKADKSDTYTKDEVEGLIRPTPITTVPTILEANKAYNLGIIDNLHLTFPSTANDGDVIYISFFAEATDGNSLNLVIDTTNTSEIELIPENATGYEIFAKYIKDTIGTFLGDYWVVNYSEHTRVG